MRTHLELTAEEKSVFAKLTREEREVVIDQLVAQVRVDIANLVTFASGIAEPQLRIPDPPKTPPPLPLSALRRTRPAPTTMPSSSRETDTTRKFRVVRGILSPR